jgi:hypothetical protein
MMGHLKSEQGQLFYQFNLEDAVPDDHLVRQGCSTLFTESHGKDGFETAECCGVAVLGDRIGLVDPQDTLSRLVYSRSNSFLSKSARLSYS